MTFSAPNIIGVTRRLLRGLGVSSYLARQLTITLNPQERRGLTYVYALPDVLLAITEYVERPRTQAKTRQVLELARAELIPQLQNVFTVPFGQPAIGDKELQRLCIDLIRSRPVLDRKLSNAKLGLAEFRGRA